jgi:hypothetical protein
MLNPDFWLDEEVSAVSPHARLLYMGLWGICDDNYATLPDRPDWIKIQVFPYDSVNTRELLDELEKIGKIVKFEYDGKQYWYIKNFFKHQRIDRPSKPKYPKYSSPRVILDEPSTTTRLKGSKEDKISKKASSKEEIRNATHLRTIGDTLRSRGILPPKSTLP